MSLVEDDSINGTVSTDHKPNKQLLSTPKSLRDRILDFALNHEKPTKGSIFINVSSSGTAGSIISALISDGIFIEKKFDCGNCVYFEVDETRVKLA